MLTDPESQEWEVIVVGTGMGGSTLGYALARQGKRVLFCEQGSSHFNGNDSLKGSYAELFLDDGNTARQGHRDILSKAGRWSEEIQDHSSSRHRQFVPFIGCGTGGSTALYGMALERLFPSDFTPRENHPAETGAALPEQWPISYSELTPYYRAAEVLYRVRGTPDPKRPEDNFEHLLDPPTLSAAGNELNAFLIDKGLHPYRVPQACEYASGCECCQGFLCAKQCKNDSAKICLMPAIRQFNSDLLQNCTVIALEASRTRVTGVICLWRGRRLKLRGSVVVLAAGALPTPAILLRSSSSAWPEGLGNSSGMVGKYLMRHFIDLYAVLPKNNTAVSPFKELAFNDLYQSEGEKFGTVQTFGKLPPAAMILEGLEKKLQQEVMPPAAAIFRRVKRVIQSPIDGFFSRRLIFASIMEDLPYPENTVLPSKSGSHDSSHPLVLRYTVSEHQKARLKSFRKRIRAILKPYRKLAIYEAGNNQRIAHACGTCRFGSDPATSVLDRNNQVYGIENLYIVDSSFFPSSGGTNPALTIAANALRVADHINGIENRVQRTA